MNWGCTKNHDELGYTEKHKLGVFSNHHILEVHVEPP